MQRLFNTIVAILIAAAACAPQTGIEKLYQDPSHAAPYARLLVIGIAAEPGQRRLMEDLITRRSASRIP